MDRSFRRKQDDRPYLIATRLHFDENGFYLPPGVLGGQSLQLMLSSLEARTRPATDFDRLPIPYRAVAADLSTGNAVILESGSLASAMRASMSIPGMFAPVVRDGRLLADGGSVANLPVGIAKDLGAATVIAVDISSPLMGPGKEIKNFWDVFSQMNSLLTVGNRQRDVERLDDDDLYLRPELGDLGFLDFDRATEAVGIGQAAAEGIRDELAHYSVDDESWSRFLARHRSHPRDEIRIDRVELENSSRFDDDLVRSGLGLETPAKLDLDELDRKLLRLHNLRHSGVSSYRIEGSGEQTTLVVSSPPPECGPHTLQLGMSFFDLFFLGGPGRLSGLGTLELYGETMALARLGLRRRLKEISFSSIRIKLFAGASIEAGDIVFEEVEQRSLSFDNMRLGGSVYIAAETPVGPMYVGWGVTENSRNRFYIAIGDHY